MKIHATQKRLLYVVLAIITVILGLLSRSEHIPLPQFIPTYAGDTLWALMVFWCVCILRPNWRIWKTALTAVLFSFAVELSQFYHALWIDNLRNTKLGGLILGFGFKASDLVCYLVGVLLGILIVAMILKPNRNTSPTTD